MRSHLVVATRRSALALAQTRIVVHELQTVHPQLRVGELHVTTTGDRIQDRPLTELGGKGLFVKEVEEALLEGRADFAVHSLKDLPAEVCSELVVGCVPRRKDPRDLLVTRDGSSLASLRPGVRVGTGSLRRQIQLRRQRPDLELVAMRGNVDTRLKRCQSGSVEGVVLAQAGLERLGLTQYRGELLDPRVCLPAVGQGALAIEWRQQDRDLCQLFEPMHHCESAIAVAAERGVMVAVDGSCRVPLAAYAVREDGMLWLRGLLAEPDGSHLRSQELRRPWPDSASAAERMGRELGEELRRS